MFGISLETVSFIVIILSSLIGVGYNYVLKPLWDDAKATLLLIQQTREQLIVSPQQNKEELALLRQELSITKEESRERGRELLKDIRELRDLYTSSSEAITRLEYLINSVFPQKE